MALNANALRAAAGKFKAVQANALAAKKAARAEAITAAAAATAAADALAKPAAGHYLAFVLEQEAPVGAAHA